MNTCKIVVYMSIYNAVAIGLLQTILTPLASQFIVSNTGSTGLIPSTE